jgi:hypothetical protein
LDLIPAPKATDLESRRDQQGIGGPEDVPAAHAVPRGDLVGIEAAARRRRGCHGSCKRAHAIGPHVGHRHRLRVVPLRVDYRGDTLLESVSIKDASEGSGKSLEMQAKASAGIQSRGLDGKAWQKRSLSVAT